MDTQTINTLTSEQCLQAVNIVTTTLDRFAISLSPTSDLAMMLSNVRWLATFEGDVMRRVLDEEADQNRAAQAFLETEQLRRIALSIELMDRVTGAEHKMFALRKKLDRLRGHDSRHQDTLFELEIAGCLAGLPVCVSFDEPDVTIEDTEGTRFGIACKRPRTVGSAREALRRAAAQIREHDFTSVIALGIEPIMQSVDSGKRPIWIQCNSQEQFWQAADAELDRVASQLSTCIAEVVGDRVAGVVMYGTVTAYCSSPNAYLWRRLRRVIPALEDHLGSGFARLLHHALGGYKDIT